LLLENGISDRFFHGIRETVDRWLFLFWKYPNKTDI